MASQPTGGAPQGGRTDSAMLAEIVHHLSKLLEEQRKTNALLERLLAAPPAP